MLTFSLNTDSSDVKYASEVWQVIVELKKYFYFYNKNEAEEAMHRAYMHAMGNKKEKYGDLKPYIKKLARTIMRSGNCKEYAYSLYDEENGEISFVFSQTLKEEMNINEIADSESLLEELRDMYLLNPDDFMKFKAMFNDDISEMNIIKNSEMNQQVKLLTSQYGSKAVIAGIEKVLNEIRENESNSNAGNVDENYGLKEITLKEANIEKYENRLCIDESIKSEKGVEGYISLSTYKTEPFNPDMVKWSVKTTCPIIKCDISPLINYMYEKLFVQKGVNNEFITWMGNRYRLTSPGGYSCLNKDIQLFMDIIHKELIINMLRENVNKIIAISDDSVYIKPTRGAVFKTIRLKLVNGKIIDLPCEVYQKGDRG